MKIRKGLVLRKIGDEHVIVAEGIEALDLKCMVGVNDAVALLWHKMNEADGFTEEDLTTILCQEYELTEFEAQKDVEKLLDQWIKLGIII